jgi:hypothetical protein
LDYKIELLFSFLIQIGVKTYTPYHRPNTYNMSKLSYSDAVIGAEKPIEQVKAEIRDLIRRSIERIDEGHIIRHSEADGCDEYGIQYWVYCDDWSGREWDLDEAIAKAYGKNRAKMIHQGIRLGTKTYQLSPKMFYQNWSSTRDFQNFKVELLTEAEQFAIAGNTEKLSEIRAKIILKSNEQLKESNYPKGFFFVAYALVNKIENLLKMVLLTSPEDFKQSLYYLDSNVSLKNQITSKIKKLIDQLDESDRIFLGFE